MISTYYKNFVSLSLHVLGCEMAGRVVEWVGSDFCAPKLCMDWVHSSDLRWAPFPKEVQKNIMHQLGSTEI